MEMSTGTQPLQAVCSGSHGDAMSLYFVKAWPGSLQTSQILSALVWSGELGVYLSATERPQALPEGDGFFSQ